ncbi:hypothetical protein [Micromonospora sp. NPDC005174]|uniref:hypothetical protein n=1 Tax=Micromonospora sp. NPDC005174 TaxID=3157018 RepID=UPI00339DE43A
MTDTRRVVVAHPFTPESAALNFAARLLRLDHEDHELLHSHLAATAEDVPAIREALRDLADRLSVGAILPAGTKTVEQPGIRIRRNGVVISEEPVTREQAQIMVQSHEAHRAANPDWRGSAELIHRHQHTTPWATIEEKS